jgi:hypothetical protein
MVRWLSTILVLASCGGPSDPGAAEPRDKRQAVTLAGKANPEVGLEDAGLVARVFDISELPAWGPWPARAEERAVQVHVADAPAALVRYLVAGRTPLVARAESPLIRGRVAGASMSVTRARFARAHSIAKPAPTPTLPARGRRKVKRYGVSVKAARLALWLGLRGRVNVVLEPPRAPELVVRLERVRWDVALARLVDTLGAAHFRHGRTHFITGSVSKRPDPALLRLNGPAIELASAEATAAEILAAVAQVTPLTYRVACNADRPISLWMRRAPTGDVLAAVQLMSGASLSRKGPTCSIKRLKARPGPGFVVVATVTNGARSAAVLRSKTGESWHVVDGARLAGNVQVSVAPYSVTIPPRGPMSISIGPYPRRPSRQEVLNEMRSSRLAATAVSPGERHAILEADDGTFSVISVRRTTTGWSGTVQYAGDSRRHSVFFTSTGDSRLFRIAPGLVEISRAKAGGDPVEYKAHLRPRP